MKNNDCLFSDIQNLCNTVSVWLIQKINNPIETNETISCAYCHIVCDNSGTSLGNRKPPLTYNGENDVHLFLVVFDPILFILTGNEDMHKISVQISARLDH